MRLTKREVVAVIQLVVVPLDGAVVGSLGIIIIVILDISFLSAFFFEVDGAPSLLDDNFLTGVLNLFLCT
jgi:hypothetical protein